LAQGRFVAVGAFATIQAGGRGAPWPLAVAAASPRPRRVDPRRVAVVAHPRLQIAIVTLAFQLAAQNYVYPDHRLTGADLTLDRPSVLATPTKLFYFDSCASPSSCSCAAGSA